MAAPVAIAMAGAAEVAGAEVAAAATDAAPGKTEVAGEEAAGQTEVAAATDAAPGKTEVAVAQPVEVAEVAGAEVAGQSASLNTNQKNHNTISYRIDNIHKKYTTDLLGIQYKHFVNPDKFDIGETLSKLGDTGQDSYVISIKSKKTDYQYVLKVTGLLKNDVLQRKKPKYNFPD